MTQDIRDVLNLALDALENAVRYHGITLMSDPPQNAWKYHKVEDKADNAITAIKEALAQTQEPVAWMHQNRFTGKATIIWDLGLATPNQNWKPLYTTPPQRTWVRLTDEQTTQVIKSMPKKMKGFMIDWDLHDFSKAIEAKLKEKNGFAEERKT